MVGVQATNTNNVSAKACPGRPRRIVARRLGLLDFVAARLRASSTDSSCLFERSGLRARSELHDGPRNQANPGESVRSTDRLVDAPRPARTRLCRVPRHSLPFHLRSISALVTT